MTTKHSYVGRPKEEDGHFIARCGCGWKSAAVVQQQTASKHLVDHLAKGRAAEEKAEARRRSETGKKAAKTRKRNQRLGL